MCSRIEFFVIDCLIVCFVASLDAFVVFNFFIETFFGGGGADRMILFVCCFGGCKTVAVTRALQL
jgi:hypothetical protein